MDCPICNKKLVDTAEGGDGQPPPEKKVKSTSENGGDDGSVVHLPCGHGCHKGCLAKWYQQNISKEKGPEMTALQNQIEEMTLKWMSQKYQTKLLETIMGGGSEDDVELTFDDDDLSEECKKVVRSLQSKWSVEFGLPLLEEEEEDVAEEEGDDEEEENWQVLPENLPRAQEEFDENEEEEDEEERNSGSDSEEEDDYDEDL